MKTTIVLSAALGFALTSSWFGPALALPPQTISQDHAVTEGQSEISDQEFRAFAKAYVQFHKIRSEYEPQLGSAASDQEKGHIEQEAVAKFSAALEREGLSMERFGALHRAISTDPALRHRAIELVEEERAKS